ncbi:hypothetical protein ACHAWF_012715 [Thalassiosira exigua]
MPSRKRNKGRQRKARAASRNVGPSMPRPPPSASSNLGILLNGDCWHGVDQLAQMNMENRKRVLYFMTLFQQRWREMSQNDANMSSQVGEGRQAQLSSAYRAIELTHAMQPDFLGDTTLREAFKRTILWEVTKAMLEAGYCESNIFASSGHAIVIVIAENYDQSSSELCRFGDDAYWKNRRVFNGCWRSLVKFYAKRIPCNCLDGLLAEVKSQPKTLLCSNCSVRMEMTALKVCNGCKATDYCSIECQRSDWPRHQKCCKKLGDLRSKK